LIAMEVQTLCRHRWHCHCQASWAIHTLFVNFTFLLQWRNSCCLNFDAYK
jgi:hypothetical protein